MNLCRRYGRGILKRTIPSGDEYVLIKCIGRLSGAVKQGLSKRSGIRIRAKGLGWTMEVLQLQKLLGKDAAE
jgi:hypothetical protein